MKNTWPSRLFFVLGAILWIPISIGIIAMINIGQALTVFSVIALGIAYASVGVSFLIRRLL